MVNNKYFIQIQIYLPYTKINGFKKILLFWLLCRYIGLAIRWKFTHISLKAPFHFKLVKQTLGTAYIFGKIWFITEYYNQHILWTNSHYSIARTININYPRIYKINKYENIW